jgi:hypothetical protein
MRNSNRTAMDYGYAKNKTLSLKQNWEEQNQAGER